jgi:thiol-disulfide isomerase/thioredoxin
MKLVKRIVVVTAALLLTLGVAHARELKPYTGGPLPAFTLKDPQGKAHTLGDYRGKVVLINFWATWCPPCVHEMPSLMRLQQKFEGKPFVILAVNMGEDLPTVQAFLAKMKVDLPILLDSDGAVLRDWRVFAFPTTFVLDVEGNIKLALFGAAEWDAPEVVKQVTDLLPK